MKKILFIEDETDLVAMLKTRIEASGYQFLSATDGEAGLKIAFDEKPDLILLDIIMPKMNGYETCYALKNNDETKGIPVIIITASGAKMPEQECVGLDAEEIIYKPYDAPHLMERISFYLNRACRQLKKKKI